MFADVLSKEIKHHRETNRLTKLAPEHQDKRLRSNLKACFSLRRFNGRQKQMSRFLPASSAGGGLVFGGEAGTFLGGSGGGAASISQV